MCSCSNEKIVNHLNLINLPINSRLAHINRLSIHQSIISASQTIYNKVLRKGSSRVILSDNEVYSGAKGSIVRYNKNSFKYEVAILSNITANCIDSTVSIHPDNLIPMTTSSRKASSFTTKRYWRYSLSFTQHSESNSACSTPVIKMIFYKYVYDCVPRHSTGSFIKSDDAITDIIEQNELITERYSSEYMLLFESWNKFYEDIGDFSGSVDLFIRRDTGMSSPTDDRHIVTFPFKVETDDIYTAGKALYNGLDRSNENNFSDESIMNIIGKDHIIINQSTLHSILPGGNLNDSIVNLTLSWFIAGKSNIIFFRKSFLSQLLLLNSIDLIKETTLKLKISIMDKKMIILPHQSTSSQPWSFFVIINPGAITQRHHVIRNRRSKTFLVYIDPSDSNRKAVVMKITSKLYKWLSHVWNNEIGDGTTKTLKFNDRSAPLIMPMLPKYCKFTDSGIHMLWLINRVLKLSNIPFNANDMNNTSDNIITKSISSSMNPEQLYAMRMSLYLLVCRLGEMFKSRVRSRVMSNMTSLVELYQTNILHSDRQSLDDTSESTPSDDKMREDTSYTAKDSGLTSSKDNTNSISGKTSVSTSEISPFTPELYSDISLLSKSIMTGYEIEYKPVLADTTMYDDYIKSAIINQIIWMDSEIGYKLILSNHDQIDRCLHLIRVSKFRIHSTGDLVTNPYPSWLSYDDFNFIPTNLLVTEFLPVGQSSNKRKKNRIKNLIGQTCLEVQLSQRQNNKSITLSPLDNIHASNLTWENITNDEQKTTYKAINRLYSQCVNFGLTSRFYESGITECENFTDFKSKRASLNVMLSRMRQKDRISLNIQSTVNYFNSPNKASKQFTTRELLIREKAFEFEYNNRCLTISTCPHCLSNLLIVVEYNSSSVDSEVCNGCKSNDKVHSNPNYYIDSKSHPVWYERNESGQLIFDATGKPVIRYDIPSVLSNLTMAEKLLIRRYQPFIPSHHIRNGVYGLRGHCVAFPQDISEVCDVLPRQQKSVVTFIRFLSNANNIESFPQQLKVRKDNVLHALKWLKIHHTGYSHIEIRESNLNWMGTKKSMNITRLGNTINISSKIADKVSEVEEFVSIAHTVDENDTDDLKASIIQTDISEDVNLSPECTSKLQDLIKAKISTSQLGDCLIFPSINTEDPVS